jgi:hypothetical protein
MTISLACGRRFGKISVIEIEQMEEKTRQRRLADKKPFNSLRINPCNNIECFADLGLLPIGLNDEAVYVWPTHIE